MSQSQLMNGWQLIVCIFSPIKFCSFKLGKVEVFTLGTLANASSSYRPRSWLLNIYQAPSI